MMMLVMYVKKYGISMIKRLLDIFISAFGIIFFFPFVSIAIFLVWIQDWKNPFYVAPRVGKDFVNFPMIKIRSMIYKADKSGVSSTSVNDSRITKIGSLIRKFKLDEITQLINVFLGQMSLVGPRPNVVSEVAGYTQAEKKLLSVRPGITDFSSIVFSDEGEILKNSKDPDHDYNILIRPWKSKLGLFYIDNQNCSMDLKIILYTIIGISSKEKALNWVSKKIYETSQDKTLASICKRSIPLSSPAN